MEAPCLPCPSCSAQSLHTQLCARVIQTALPPVCVLRQPESPGTGASPGKGSARLRGTERWCCPGCGASAEPPRPGCCPSSESQTRLCQASFIFFPPFNKGCTLFETSWTVLFVLKVQVRIQTWHLVLTSPRSWANVPGPTNWNSRNVLDFFSQQRLPSSGNLITTKK